MALHDLAEAPLQEIRVERASEPKRGRDVVEGAAGLELVEKPQTLLRERQREVAVALCAPERRDRLCSGTRTRPLDRARQSRHRGRLEQRAQRQLDAEPFPDTRDELRGQKRMPAGFEEVVVETDALDLEDAGPQAGQFLLVRSNGRRERLARRRARRARRREGPAVQLAVRGPRQRLQVNERRRDHVLRQPRGQVAAQLAQGRGRRPRLPDDVRHQTSVAIRLLAHLHDRLGDPRMGVEDRLDLPRLDPEAADFYLMVDPAQKVDRPVGAEAAQVAGPVQARPRLPAERVRDETLRGQIGTVHVAAARADAADVDLPGHSGRHRLQALVEDVHAGVRDRPADRRGPGLASVEPGHRGVDRRLRQAVEVDDLFDRLLRVNFLDQGALQRLARQAHGAHRARHAARSQQLGDRRRNRVDESHGIALRKRRQVQGVFRQDDRAAPRQRGEDLEHRRVEADRAAGEDTRQLFFAERLARPAKKRHGAAVLDRRPLRPPGRA